MDNVATNTSQPPAIAAEEISSPIGKMGDINHAQSLISLYTKLHPEIIAYQTFLFNLLITTTVLFFTGAFYGLNSGKQIVLAALPPLIALTYGLGFNANSGILRIAFKKLQIELILQKEGLKWFDWETEFGALGVQRKPMIENLILVLLLSTILCFGFTKTFDGTLIPVSIDMSQKEKYPISIFNIFGVIDSLSVAFLILCILRFAIQKRKYKQKIKSKKLEYGIK